MPPDLFCIKLNKLYCSPEKLKIYWQILILLFLASCAEKESAGPDGGPVEPPEPEITEIVCPVHEVPVHKVHASYAISCHAWDPKLGLTVEQIRNRFPYAIWDSNLHRVDESEGAKFPRYNLVCNRCQDSWGKYAAENSPPPDDRFVISITEFQKILINETEFSIEQVTAVAKATSSHYANPRLLIRAHRSTDTEIIKSVVDACAEAGLTDVIFGSYDTGSEMIPQQAANKPE